LKRGKISLFVALSDFRSFFSDVDPGDVSMVEESISREGRLVEGKHTTSTRVMRRRTNADATLIINHAFKRTGHFEEPLFFGMEKKGRYSK
jgi:hypothetical protein